MFIAPSPSGSLRNGNGILHLQEGAIQSAPQLRDCFIRNYSKLLETSILDSWRRELRCRDRELRLSCPSREISHEARRNATSNYPTDNITVSLRGSRSRSTCVGQSKNSQQPGTNGKYFAHSWNIAGISRRERVLQEARDQRLILRFSL